MIKNLYKRFLLWVLAPALSEIKIEVQVLERRVDLIGPSDISTLVISDAKLANSGLVKSRIG